MPQKDSHFQIHTFNPITISICDTENIVIIHGKHDRQQKICFGNQHRKVIAWVPAMSVTYTYQYQTVTVSSFY